MRIAITNPSTWPRVRRGAERFLNELAFFLAQRGHEVTVIACKPGRREVVINRGYKTVCHRRWWHPSLAKLGVLEFHAFMVSCCLTLMRERFDVVHCCTFADAYGASIARRFTRTPYVLWINGMPPKVRYIRTITLGGAVFKRAVLKADEVIALSEYMRNYFENRFGRGGVRVPVPVDMDRFELSTRRDMTAPVILCAAALDDERKGGRVLMRAFERVKKSFPTARLKVSANVPANVQRALLDDLSPRWRQDVHFLGAGQLHDLPRLFGQAAVSVLPSVWEAFGMVILESMATGTPVVGTRDGGIPELITDPAVGRLFDPGDNVTTAPTNVEGLRQALVDGIALSRDPQTAHRCRAHAEQYAWSQVGPVFESIYERVIHDRRASNGTAAPDHPAPTATSTP